MKLVTSFGKFGYDEVNLLGILDFPLSDFVIQSLCKLEPVVSL